tara:strand:+ start:3563 stop:7213 length:3651 start_codon:yes stop_codon:yes gene_type:complete
MTQLSNQNTWAGQSIFEDVYIYGTLHYDFKGDAAFRNLELDTLKVLGNSEFLGLTTFYGDVDIKANLNTEYLTVFQRLDVGAGGTVFTGISTGAGPEGGRVGVANTEPLGRFQVGGPNTTGVGGEVESKTFIVTNDGIIGIGTTIPGRETAQMISDPVKLDVQGSVRISKNIFDSAESPGVNGYYLNRDVDGIRWVEASPLSLEGIFVQDEGVYQPNPGTARTFSTLNFWGTNSLGLGTDNVTALPDIDNPTAIARIENRDYWGYTTPGANDTAIYRMTKVGIKNNNPLYVLDVTGNFQVTAEAQVGGGLNVDGATTLNNTLDVDGATTLNNTLDVDGVATFNDTTDSTLPANGSVQIDGGVGIVKRLNVGGQTIILDTTESGSKDGGALVVDGGVGIEKNLNVGGNALVSAGTDATSSSTGALRVVGGAGIGEDLFVGEDAEIEGTTGSTSTNSGALIVRGGTGIAQNLFVGNDVKIEGTTESNDKDTGALIVDGGVGIEKKLNVGSDAKIDGTTQSTSKDTGALIVDGGVGIEKDVHIGGTTQSEDTDTGALVVGGGAGIEKNVNIGGSITVADTTVSTSCTTGSAVFGGGIGVGGTVYICGDAIVEGTTQSTDKDTGALIVDGGAGIEKNLNVGEDAKIIGTLELENSIIDKLNSVGYDASRTKNDYRLSAVGSGVSWRPSGVDTDNAIWVTVDGDDTNTGLLEGDAKRTVGAAASIAKEGDTIIIRSGTYTENNPIGLRTDVSVSGEDLRLVTIIPQNRTKDVFHVRRGCLIQNLNFSGPQDDGQGGVSYNHPGCAAAAFPPLDTPAATGYAHTGPANEGPSGRWKSPYVRNCTNFMTGSIGMKIDGNHANADFGGTNNLGQDFKSFVCDAFTQYNQNGIGVSLTNNAYAQLVSIFTIGCDIAIYCDSGGQCDLTNSNSSFGNVGLKADGVGAVEFTGTTTGNVAADNDTFQITNLTDVQGRYRKPFDGQGLFFKINLSDYLDITGSGIIEEPMQLIRSIEVVNGGANGDYNSAAPPIITVPNPLGPESIQAEFSANVSAAGTITSVDVLASGRNFLPNQSFAVNISGTGSAQLTANTDPILYTVSLATPPTDTVGLTTVTFNEFVPYKVNSGVDIELFRISRIITSSHSFEYIGAGTDINKANPFQGGEPITANEVIAINGGQVPFTSTDQKGNFRIGDGLTVDQTTSTIRGRDFNRAIQAQLTPLILALR